MIAMTGENNVHKSERGFTLIELLITIVVLGILMSIAVPAYQDQIRKSNRAVAKAKLLDLATRQEQYFADNKVYSNTLDAFLSLGAVDAGADRNYNWVAPSSAESIYTFDVVTSAVGGVSHMAYTLTATPAGSQTEDSAKCATLSITQTGQRSATGSLGANCWE